VKRGFGNNAEDGRKERGRRTIGRTLHGSLLPKNPALADELIGVALKRRYGEDVELTAIDDAVERSAHAVAAGVAERKSRGR
jgi:CobQ-like glutamine amidotransferase family enzyme